VKLAILSFHSNLAYCHWSADKQTKSGLKAIQGLAYSHCPESPELAYSHCSESLLDWHSSTVLNEN
jgi:hypothetical protein